MGKMSQNYSMCTGHNNIGHVSNLQYKSIYQNRIGRTKYWYTSKVKIAKITIMVFKLEY
jgi:hypothetical protein